MKTYKTIVFKNGEVDQFYLAEGEPTKIAADAFRRYGKDASVVVGGISYKSAEAVGVYNLEDVCERIRKLLQGFTGYYSMEMMLEEAKAVAGIPEQDLLDIVEKEIKILIAKNIVNVIWDSDGQGNAKAMYAKGEIK